MNTDLTLLINLSELWRQRTAETAAVLCVAFTARRPPRATVSASLQPCFTDLHQHREITITDRYKRREDRRGGTAREFINCRVDRVAMKEGQAATGEEWRLMCKTN